jgi:hypothetical protein
MGPGGCRRRGHPIWGLREERGSLKVVLHDCGAHQREVNGDGADEWSVRYMAL